MARKRGRPASSVDHRSAAADWKQRREEVQRDDQEGKVVKQAIDGDVFIGQALLDALEEESTAQVPRDEHQNTNLRSGPHTQPPRHQTPATYPAQAMPFALSEAVSQATLNSHRLTNRAHGSTATQEADYNQHFNPHDQTAFKQLRHYAASQQLFWQTQVAPPQPQFTNFQPPPVKAPCQSHRGQAPEGGVWLPPSPFIQAPLQWGGVRPGLSVLNAGAAPYQPHEPTNLVQGYHGGHSARVNEQYRTYHDYSTRASTPSEPSSSERLNGPLKTPAQPSFSRSDEPFPPRKGSKSQTRRGSTPADSRPVVTPLPVPKPTATYLSQASQEPQRLASARPLLIIIDLNGTLIHRPKHRPTSFKARPHVPDFLSYLIANYTCLVWSSAQPQNVKALCAQLFTPAQRAQLVGEWGRDTLGLNKLQYSNKVQVYKQLERWVWANEKVAQSHPQAAQGRRWTQRNTILIDDSEVKATSEPHNLVQIDEFEGKKEQMTTDVLSQVVGYLEEARWQVDVSAFIRSRPFKFGGGWKSDWSRISGTLLSRAMVEISVGSENTQYVLHEKLLCHRSKFFAKNLHDDAKSESEMKKLELPDDEDEAFEQFVGWLYSGQLRAPEEEHDLGTLFELYLMGEKWQVPKLVEETLESVRLFYQRHDAYPGLRRVQYVYANTDGDSPMRKLLVQSVARFLVLGDGMPQHWEKALRKNGQLAVDIIMCVQQWHMDPARVPDAREESCVPKDEPDEEDEQEDGEEQEDEQEEVEGEQEDGEEQEEQQVKQEPQSDGEGDEEGDTTMVNGVNGHD
ncbi:hypothetical protein B0A49_12998 [Cryomyces minteri]|uniref:BTB domain-containing protein n=1 Tax=Cryomyces minteri TaxID=331657 RepID=A0A4U0W1E2_9PEZI|nr:hypothetical protein B0A49_12998 [Cryomyces minteri]